MKKSTSVVDLQPPTHLVCLSTPVQPWVFVTVTFSSTTLHGFGDIVGVRTDGATVVIIILVDVFVLEDCAVVDAYGTNFNNES